ncbi:MAG TPA: polyhydroxyalkanoic acid system family protein [Novosphingobium sp.]|nr:polyhydroxyalkanoic acid system family protein [Novosphingobium sp.]HQA17227.1 polyhydroxyalkanoic acid system family protein [Novosphingobium sp.]
MRVPIPHRLGKEEVKRRLRERSGEMAGLFPGGADVAIDWPGEDRMAMRVAAMGQTVNAHVDVTDDQVVFEIALPAALSFVEPMVRGVVEQKAQKLLA